MLRSIAAIAGRPVIRPVIRSHLPLARFSVTRGANEAVLETMPAPGTPFHLAMPVHNLEIAKAFYGGVLGCAEGRSSTKWQDYSLGGHQIVCHWVGETYRCPDFFNPVDGDEVSSRARV